jgi:Transposase DDE domain/Domain of unknown function (DUF4372)
MSHYSSTVLSQLLEFLPKQRFDQLVGQHQGDYYTKSLTTWNQFIALLYAQATGKDSLREVATGLTLHAGTWYHLGINSVARSSLSRANNKRDPQIFQELFYTLLEQCQGLTETKTFSFKNPLYALDSSTIRLCLSLFSWAHYTKQKGALKLHALLDVRTSIPSLIVLTDGKAGDITTGRDMDLSYLEKGSIVVFDRGYVDFRWWRYINEQGLFFVSRTKRNSGLLVVGQHTEPKGTVLADEYVVGGDIFAQEKYPEKLRKIRAIHKGEGYEYVTNNLVLSGEQIVEVYTARWQVELFFKWIKQNLVIKSFLGTSENAVLSQIWVSMIYYLLVAYIKFQTKFSRSLLELTRMFREVLLTRRNLIDLLSLKPQSLQKFTHPPWEMQRLF